MGIRSAGSWLLVVASVVGCGAEQSAPGEELAGHTHTGPTHEHSAPDVLSDNGVLSANAEDGASEFGTSENGVTTQLPFGLTGDVSAARVRLTVLQAAGLSKPFTLGFKPQDGSLWISNRGDDSTVIIDNVGKTTQRAARFVDDSAHFMNNPTQLAFSALLPEFAVSLESVNDYNGQAQGNLFTGVTLFTSNRSQFEGGTMSHLDMLHHSPLSMGVAIGARPSSAALDKREYWVFNGHAGSIDRYFFQRPHALGADDHSDGITIRYGAGSLKRVANVPSHLAFDAVTKQLYVADTGNRRIARLDTRVPVQGSTRIRAYHNETPLYGAPTGAAVAVTGTSSGLVAPAGLLLYKNVLIVSDFGTGHIRFFSIEGKLLATVDTGRGTNALTGLAVGPDGKLYLLDAKKNQLLRFDPPGI